MIKSTVDSVKSKFHRVNRCEKFFS